MSEVRIAVLDVSQLGALSLFYHNVWHETHSALLDPRVALTRDVAFFQERLERWIANTLVGWLETSIAGFASSDGPVLEALFASPSLRSRGIGAALLAAAENRMAAAGHRPYQLDCVCSNIGAQAFYERHGWRVAGVDDQHDGRVADAVTRHWVMVKP